MKENVDSFTPLCGKYIKNHVFYVSNSNSVNHFWQDGVTGSWNESHIPLPTS
jgi:hypothetical protein